MNIKKDKDMNVYAEPWSGGYIDELYKMVAYLKSHLDRQACELAGHQYQMKDLKERIEVLEEEKRLSDARIVELERVLKEEKSKKYVPPPLRVKEKKNNQKGRSTPIEENIEILLKDEKNEEKGGSPVQNLCGSPLYFGSPGCRNIW